MIDVFSHFVPEAALKRMRALAPSHPALGAFAALPQLWDVGARLRSLEPFPELAQVMNFGNPPPDTFGPPPVAASLARVANEAIAALCDEHPERFPAFTAVLPMSDPELACQELARSVDQLGAKGIQVFTNVLGAPLSDPRFRPVFAEAASRDVPILVHPYRTAQVPDYATEQESRDEVWFTFGWPYETSAFAARMVYSGIFEEFPDLKLVLHHFGGMVPSFAARINLGFRQIFSAPGAPNPVAVSAGLHGEPTDHFHRFYADTAVNGSHAAVHAGYSFFGPERSVFGTDAPFSQDGGASFVQGALDAIDALGLSPGERHQVLEGNARSLFALDVASPITQAAP